jgi:hypothetical protein
MLTSKNILVGSVGAAFASSVDRLRIPTCVQRANSTTRRITQRD